MSTDDVINWSEAMDQCGDDEEFLTELLSDLRGEVDAQMVKIDDALKVRHAPSQLTTKFPCLVGDAWWYLF
jgi:hypothetical protein